MKHASVSIDGKETARIGEGFLILLGVTHEDTEAQAVKLAEKLTGLRIFEDETGKMNRGLTDVGGEVLIVNHFARDYGMLSRLERAFAPFANLLGWHSDFPMARVLGDPRLSVAADRTFPPFGMFTFLTLSRA